MVSSMSSVAPARVRSTSTSMSTVNGCGRERSAALTPCRPSNAMPSSRIRSTSVNLDFGAMEVLVRAATMDDLQAVNDIYNEYVLTTHFTFDVDPMTLAARREWFAHYGSSGRHRVLVAVREGGVVGYTTSSRFRPKVGYDTSIETSIYLGPGATGAGIGTRLYEALFQVLHGEDVHRAYAGIALPNPASIAL